MEMPKFETTDGYMDSAAEKTFELSKLAIQIVLANPHLKGGGPEAVAAITQALATMYRTQVAISALHKMK